MANDDFDVTLPIDHTKVSVIPSAIRDVTSSVKIVISKEHVIPGTDCAGGQHVKGSARVYLESTLPTLDPEGNSLSTGADTSDNGRISVYTHVSTSCGNNVLRVYVATSAGVSTGWQLCSVNRVYLTEAQECNGNALNGLPYATQSTQPMAVRQLDTTFFSFLEPSTTSLVNIKCGTGIETSHANGLRVKMAPLGYAGEESVTLPNGLIMKFGHSTNPTGNQSGTLDSVTINFGTPFPTGIMGVVITVRENTGTLCTCVVSSSVSGFVAGIKEVQSATQTMAGFDWMAIGY